MDRERWLPVVGYEGYYEISNHGRVKRIGKYGGAVVGRILKPWQDSKGYLVVSTYDGHDHKLNKKVHRLVAQAFIGSPPVGRGEIRHKDGNPGNNHLKNLAWGNNADNKADMLRHGRSTAPINALRGEKTWNSKLTCADIINIRKLLSSRTQTSLAKQFGVSQPCISAIKCGLNWGWLENKKHG